MQITQKPRQQSKITAQTIADYFGVSYRSIQKHGEQLDGGLKNLDNLFEIIFLLFLKKGGKKSKAKVITPPIIAEYFGVSLRTLRRKAQKNGKKLDDTDFLFSLISSLQKKEN